MEAGLLSMQGKSIIKGQIHMKIYIFDSELGWQMQLMIMKRLKIRIVCVGNF